MTSITQEVLQDLAELYRMVDEHLAYDKSNCQKINKMYEILVEGDKSPPLPETVRRHDTWIEEQKEAVKETDRRKFEYKKGIILLAVGQAVTLIVGAAAFLKR